MLIAHRIALDPNNVQATYFARAAGTARFAYNWALAEWQQQYEAWKADNSQPKPSQAALRRQLNAIKREQFPWMLKVTKNAPQMAIIQLGQAFQNFFAGQAKYPQFRKKGQHDRFSLTNDQFDIDGSRLRIPNLGWVCMRESLRFAGKFMSATISRVADRWFVSITVDTENSSHLPQAENQGVVGVDFLHQLTTSLTRRFHTIGIEDLNVRGMVKNRRLARSLADMGFFEFRRQLEYKAALRGGQIVVADRFYPSSKTCWACGHKLEVLPLSVRRWACPACGRNHDRDVNAALNLKNLAVSSTVSAWGEEGSGHARKSAVKPASRKQEASSGFCQR